MGNEECPGKLKYIRINGEPVLHLKAKGETRWTRYSSHRLGAENPEPYEWASPGYATFIKLIKLKWEIEPIESRY